MSEDINATPDLLLLIQQKLRIMQCRYCSLSHQRCSSRWAVYLCLHFLLHRFKARVMVSVYVYTDM